MIRLPVFLDVAALHIPDGFLSVPIALLGLLIAVLIVAYALRQTGDILGERQIPVLGVMAAFVFAAQSINFPVLGGTSGHLLGAALVAIVVGPWPAVLVMTVVVGLQGLLFQDGGLLALGWNIVNMATLAVLVGWLAFGVVKRLLGSGRKSLIMGTMIAAWLSVLISATATGVELAASDPGLLAAIPAMAGIHAVIGVGEALITAAAIVLISRARPAMLDRGRKSVDVKSAYVFALGLIVVFVIAALSVISSARPDGLERVALDYGFADRAIDPLLKILPDYTIPGVDGSIGGVIVVLAGAMFAALSIVFASCLLRHRRLQKTQVNDNQISAAGD